MPDPVSVQRFRLEIARLHRRFNVLSFSASEAVSQPFAFELEVVSDGVALDLAGLMYAPAFLSINGSRQGFHGQIQGATLVHHSTGTACYRLKMGPRLACLGLRYNQRVFQHMSATQIIMRVLEEHGLKDSYRFDLRTERQARDICLQYNESDLQLLQRLCAEEGIHYHFDHSYRRHELVFGDGLRGLRRAPIATWRDAEPLPGVTAFTVLSEGDDVPGSRAHQRAQGESTLPFVACGQLLPLADHPRMAWNHMWLTTHVEHHFQARPRTLPSTGHGYRNHFRAVPWEVGIAPPVPLPSPLGKTLQCAWLLGPVGKTVERDAAGRLHAQFDWGRQGAGARYGSCWLPVDPGLETQCTGGAAVVVSFQEHDIGRPIITAILHTAPRVPPDQPITEADDCTKDRHSENLQMQLDWRVMLDGQQTVQLDDGSTVNLHPDSQLILNVGTSQARFEGAELTLISPQITFTNTSVPDAAKNCSDPDNVP